MGLRTSSRRCAASINSPSFMQPFEWSKKKKRRGWPDSRMPFRVESAMPELASASSSNHTDHAPQRSGLSDDDFQSLMLQGVSRTFALTIPQLPPSLRQVVSNAYLLCRVVDTIEDEPVLSIAQKHYFCQQFLKALSGENDDERFSERLSALLSNQTTPAEAELIRNIPR